MIIILLNLFLILFLLTSCPYSSEDNYSLELDQFDRMASEMSTTRYLIPAHTDNQYVTLIDDFEYVGGKFYRYTHASNIFVEDIDKCLMYIEYTQENYQKAKESVFGDCDNNSEIDYLSEQTYNEYHFFTSYYDNRDKVEVLNAMAGYNDDKNRLVFISIYCSTTEYTEADLLDTDFEGYLKSVYGEWYDFDS